MDEEKSRQIGFYSRPDRSRMNFNEGMEVLAFNENLEYFYEKMICLNQEASCPLDSIPDDKRGWVRNRHPHSQSSTTGVDEFRIELRSGRYIRASADEIFPARLYKAYWSNFKNELIAGKRAPLRDGWWLNESGFSDIASDSPSGEDEEDEEQSTQLGHLFPIGMMVVIPARINDNGTGLFDFNVRLCSVQSSQPWHHWYELRVEDTGEIIRNVHENNIATCRVWEKITKNSPLITHDFIDEEKSDQILSYSTRERSRMRLMAGMNVIVYHENEDMKYFYEKMICLDPEASCPLDSIPDNRKGQIRNSYRGSRSSTPGVDEFRIELKSGSFIVATAEELFPARLYKIYWTDFKNQLIANERLPLRDGWWLNESDSSDDDMSPRVW
jgi:hypothetical protein